jgi:predicted transcriptional regulator
MTKPKKPDKYNKVNVRIASAKDFFERGKVLARQLDKGEKITPQRTISFEDPDDLVKFLTQTKRELLNIIRKKPNSISELANILHRSRSSVDKDIQMLESVGIVESKYMVNPGHGRCRIISPTDSRPIKLKVETVI